MNLFRRTQDTNTNTNINIDLTEHAMWLLVVTRYLQASGDLPPVGQSRRVAREALKEVGIPRDPQTAEKLLHTAARIANERPVDVIVGIRSGGVLNYLRDPNGAADFPPSTWVRLSELTDAARAERDRLIDEDAKVIPLDAYRARRTSIDSDGSIRDESGRVTGAILRRSWRPDPDATWHIVGGE